MSYAEKPTPEQLREGAYVYTFVCKVCSSTFDFRADNMQIALFRGYRKHDKENPDCKSDRYRIYGAGATQEN